MFPKQIFESKGFFRKQVSPDLSIVLICETRFTIFFFKSSNEPFNQRDITKIKVYLFRTAVLVKMPTGKKFDNKFCWSSIFAVPTKYTVCFKIFT